MCAVTVLCFPPLLNLAALIKGPERKDGEMLTERFLRNISNIGGTCGLFKVFWEGKTFQGLDSSSQKQQGLRI